MLSLSSFYRWGFQGSERLGCSRSHSWWVAGIGFRLRCAWLQRPLTFLDWVTELHMLRSVFELLTGLNLTSWFQGHSQDRITDKSLFSSALLGSPFRYFYDTWRYRGVCNPAKMLCLDKNKYVFIPSIFGLLDTVGGFPWLKWTSYLERW